MSNPTARSTGAGRSNAFLMLLLVVISLAVIAYIYRFGLIEMVRIWSESEEYSHGYMIPFVALFLFYQKLPALLRLNWHRNWLGPLLMLGALLGWFLGEMSAMFMLVHYAFLGAIVALAISVIGWKGFRTSWAAFVYLVFMIPLPNFLYKGLSQHLQLLSTEIGVAVIRLFDISVYVTGNVIDLGSFQLQVAEACSGLRYLFPLMSFGFLIAYVYNGPRWHKWTIFLSSIVITILMNSFRIGVIGITVEYWGIEMAKGFLHDFEGWFVFMACLGVLFLLIIVLNYVSGRRTSPLDLLDLSYPSMAEVRQANVGSRRTLPVLIVTTVLLLAAVPVSVSISDREEIIPKRSMFIQFPLIYGGWVGRESTLAPDVLDSLDHPDYIQADYRRAGDPLPVNLYVAYYQSQRTGSSIHSPRTCIPGGGWEISDLAVKDLSSEMGYSGLRVNRLIITQGEVENLVYYWFEQRGRVITSEYVGKWYLFLDGLTMRRSDGALVRLVTPVLPNTDVADADARLVQFLHDFYPLLPDYLPGKTVDVMEITRSHQNRSNE